MNRRLHMPVWTPAAGLAAASLCICAAVQFRPVEDDLATAVFPPWWSSRASVAAAGSVGEVLAVGGFAHAVAIRSDAPDLARRARAAGALLVLRGTTAGLCALPASSGDA